MTDAFGRNYSTRQTAGGTDIYDLNDGGGGGAGGGGGVTYLATPYALLDIGITYEGSNPTGSTAATTAWGTNKGVYQTIIIPTSQVPSEATGILLRVKTTSHDDDGTSCNTKVYIKTSSYDERMVAHSFSPSNSDDGSGDMNSLIIPYTSSIDIKYDGKGPATHNTAKVFVDGYITGGGTGGGTSGGGGSSGDGHIWKFVSEGSAPLLIDNRVLFAPQFHGTNNHTRLYASDLNGVVTQTIFSGPKWPDTSGSSGSIAALRASLLADWETATSSNVDVYISYPTSYVLKISFNRSTQTFGTPSGYGVHNGGVNFFNTGWKIAACYDGGTSKHFICSPTYADGTHSKIGGSNRLEQMEYSSTGTGGYYNLIGITHYLGDFRPLIKSPDGKQLVEGSGGTGAEALYGNLIGINHVTGRVYYRGLTNGFLYIFQINPSASGSTYADKLWNMSASGVPNPVNSNLTYVKTVLLPIAGDVAAINDTTVNFDKDGNETAISYGSYYNDGLRHNVNMGIVPWDSAWT